ncbi:hypothetical protein [Persicitalea jodogahamensis]|uniref:Uncharacterized protein n=1 Tax=Persicitalea jodogahamensis TaxID=402147 RepID=A0A8J3DAC3_9BACT|nr:hypothetical protein [Persicitalea jodogahamensis]GHB73768.1 hypothetical protein GCM10007390_29930 [Persicitalea jodogahamensis]
MLTFDASPTVYWALAYALTGLVIGSNLRKDLPTWLYLMGCLAVFVLMRLPSVLFNRELNADESQMLSHAITLFQDPIYWHSVDGTTIGPLDNYLLVLPRLFGIQLDYTSARIMGLLCSIGSLLFFFIASRRWFGETTARVALLLPLVFLAFTQETDYVHYSSEQLPLLLLNICLALLAALSQKKKELSFQEKKAPVWPAYMLGFIAGMLPFAKLQAVPQALLLVAGGVYFTYQYHIKNKNPKPLLLLVLGGISFPAMALVWMLVQGIFQDFIDFYILGNAVYAGGSGIADIPTQFGKLVLLSPDFLALLGAIALVTLLGIFTENRELVKPHSVPSLSISILILGYGLVAVYAATKSGNLFVHYLNFCVYPLGLAAALGISKIDRKMNFALVGPLLLLGWFGVQDAIGFYKTRQLNSFVSVGARTLPESRIVQTMRPYVKPGDQMVVWGWQCRYYVEAQLPQGTAENHSERSIYQHPLREEYRTRYLSDMKRNRPAIFIDAVGKNSVWLGDKATQGYQSFPELAAYVDKNYQYLGEADDARLFVRKDRSSPKKK